MTNPFEQYRRPPPPPPPAPRSPPPAPRVEENPFVALAQGGGEPPEPRRMPRQMRRPEERAADPNLSPQERQRAQSEIARPTQPSSDIPARQDVVIEPTRNDGTLGDVGRAFMDITQRTVMGPLYRDLEGDDARNMERANNFIAGRGRRAEDDDTPEFRFQLVGDINDDVRWEGGPLSEALNALPRDVRTWLDTEGRLARIGVGFFLNADQNDRAEIIRNNVPTAQFRRDEYGNLQVRLRPEHRWANLNTPGLSADDALTTAETLERYTPAARIAAAPRLLATRGAVGAVTSAATEYGSQAADDVVGGPEGVDLGRVLEAGAWGGGGQVAGDVLAASAQVAKPYVQRIFGAADTPPRLPDPDAPMGSAAETYGAPPAQSRDFAAERAAIDDRARTDLQALDEQTYNGRVPAAGPSPNEIAEDLDAATRLTPGQERIIDDNLRRKRRVEQERRAAHARLDNEEFGMDLSPPAVLHDAAREAMRDGTPVFISTPQGVRRVTQVYDEGFIDEAGDTWPTAGTIASRTDDGLLFETPPRPQRREAPKPPPPPAAPPAGEAVKASDIYASSDEFGIPVTRGEAARDVAERTREFDMLHGTMGPGAQRQAAAFQDRRAEAIERAGRNIATRNQEPLSQNIEEAGQIVQNQVRERFNNLTQEINRAYHDAMTALAEVPVDRAAGERLLQLVERRLVYGRGNLDEAGDTLIPSTGYDPDLIRNATKSRLANALNMVRTLQDEIVTRSALGRNQVRFSNIEKIRQRLLELQQDAVAANDPDRYAMDLIVEGFDDWLTPALRQPPPMRIRSEQAAFDYAEQQQLRAQAESAISAARRLHAEREQLFTRQGMGDLAGRTMEQIRALDTTGTKIIDQIFGAGRIPPSQARAAVERIRDIANRSMPGSGRLGPKGESTSASRRFEGGTAHPEPELQAMREALFMRILEPLRTRTQGNQVPIQTIITNLDTAINGQGRAVTRAMFTDSEVAQIERLLSVLRYYAPTSGSRPTGVTAARMLGNALDGVTKFIGGAPGFALRSVVGIFSPGVRDASGEMAARTAFSRPMFEDGLPASQSGAGLGQLGQDNSDNGEGVYVPLEAPPTSAAQAYGADGSGRGDGSMLSADGGNTLTVEADGVFYNIPLVQPDGTRVSASEALRRFEAGEMRGSQFNTEDEALSAARQRRAAQ